MNDSCVASVGASRTRKAPWQGYLMTNGRGDYLSSDSASLRIFSN